MEVTDQQLLKNWFESRDAQVFEAIIQRYSKMVYNTALRILKNQTDAEDMTQACFETLVAAQEPRKIQTLGPWLHRVSTNLSLKHIRTNARRDQREEKYVDGSAPVAADAEWAEISVLIDEAILELDDTHRSSIIAHFLEGRSHSAIAGETDLSRSGVTKRIAKGVGDLERILKRKGVVPTVGFASFLGTRLAGATTASAPLAAELGKLALRQGTGVGAATNSSFAFSSKAVVSLTVFAIVTLPVIWFYSGNENRSRLAQIENQPNVRDNSDVQSTAAALTNGTAQKATGAVVASSVENTNSTSARVSGRIYNSRTGEPMPNAWLSKSDGTEAMTDEHGRFSMDGLKPGTHSFKAYVMGVGNFESQPKEYAITLEEGEHRSDLDFGVDLGVTIRGRVIDQYGDPVSGTKIGAAILDPTFTSFRAAGGHFYITGMHASEKLYIHASKPGYAMVPMGPLNLPESGLKDLIITMKPAASISGTLFTPQGEPMEGIYVYADTDFPILMNGHSIEPTDSEGRFVIPDLFPDDFEYRVGSDNRPPCMNCVNKPGNTLSVVAAPVRVHEGQQITNVSLTYPTDDVHVLAGVITKRNGESIGSSAHFSIRNSDDTFYKLYETDEDGTFFVPAVKEGEFMIKVTSGLPSPVSAGPFAAGDRNIVITPEQTGSIAGYVVDDSTGAAIPSFTVYLVVNGHDAIELDPRMSQSFQYSGSQEDLDNIGYFIRENVAPDSLLKIAVEADGYKRAYSERLTVEAGRQTGNVILRMKKGSGRIDGLVLSPDGEPTANAVVLKRHSAHQILNPGASGVRTDTNGRFSLPELNEQATALHAYHEDFAEGSTEIPSNLADGIEIRLTRPGKIFGRVSYNGEPAGHQGHVFVRMRDVGPNRSGSVIDHQGNYEIRSLPARDYAVSTGFVLDQPNDTAATWLIHDFIHLEEGQEAEHDFEFFTYNTTLTGTITVNGKPMAGDGRTMRLDYLPVDERWQWTPVYAHSVTEIHIEDDGTFEISGIPSGEAQLSLEDRRDRAPKMHITIHEDQTAEVTYKLAAPIK